jgi:pimeloyl-ACP methyl ester carboxylesterase
MTLASSRFPSRRFRFVPTALLPLAVAATTACGASPDPTVVAAPDGAVEVVESGTGDATVVFESGLGNDWTPWQPVAMEVAAEARTFAYSRPGYGQSAPSPEPRDAAHIVEDLRALLAARGVAPPYVLVGHSFGGAYMELFAKAHPEEVLGVVLVDPRHRDLTTACQEAGLEGCTIPAAVVATLPQVQADEFEAFAHTSEQMDAAGAFGAYPVRVLTATVHGFTPELEALWQSMLGSLADEAADGEQRIFVGAGHFLQVERAHEVARVISSLLPGSER